MAYFNRDTGNRGGRDNRGGGRGFSSSGRSSFGRGGGDDRSREMFKTVCSNCGKDCEVPFKPTTGKPVYCSDCFETMGGRSADGGRNERPERRDRPSFDRHQTPAPRVDNNKQFEDLNRKLDKIISLLTPKVEEVIAPPVVVEEVKVEKVAKTPKVKKAKVVKEKEVTPEV
ncbi:MAG: CxxC-x17-CxxC domain-containing protein [Patescibacteria group bacterium]